MPAYFTTLGDSEHRWQGHVRQIQPSPVIVNDVVLYDVLIDVNNEGRRLMTGMTTQVFFILGRADNALMLPAEVLIRRMPNADSDTGKAYQVYVVTPTGREPRTIHIGLLTRTQAEVTQGLNEGDHIATSRPGDTGGAPAGGRQNHTPRFNRGAQL
jgi:macrolide-specific efflux system membrane fusion protein